MTADSGPTPRIAHAIAPNAHQTGVKMADKLRWHREAAKTPSDSLYHGGSFAVYMSHKITKLGEQFEGQQLGNQQISQLFAGVAIHVNGLTVPTHQELKQIMALHGGRFETYYARSRVTHIICSNLPDTKLKQLAHARDPTPIVKPEWIVACLRAGQLLPTKDFQLQLIRDVPGQRQLFEFRQHRPAALAPAELYPALQQQQQQQEQQGQQQQQQDQQQGEQQTVGQILGLEQQPQQPQQHQQPQQQQLQEQQRQHQQPQHQQQQQPQQQPLQEQQHQQPPQPAQPPPQQQQPPQPPPQPPDTSLAKAQATAAALRAACDLLKGPPRSTADDPQGFMGSFFKSSRLHFIGTWKARIEALMAEQQQQGRAAAAAAAAVGRKGARSSGGGLLMQQQQQRVIVHLDMDCFFAAVAAVGRPEFAGKPLAVCHSSSAQGSGEVSSANYEARAFGIRAGMFMAEAKGRCPELLVVPYEFDKYEDASEQVYRILLRHTSRVQALSCDEAFLDLTDVAGDPEQLVAAMRAEIVATTGCTASAGIGPNPLLARLATKQAKPNGQGRVSQAQGRALLGELGVSELPGVGRSMRDKLADMGITQVRQVWSFSKEVLMRRLGQKTGQALWQHAHGIDDRQVELPSARRSVGAEVNWGVRFASDTDAQKFLQELSGEVALRLAAAGTRARCLTLKLKRRQAGAPEPAKFLGHGVCDNISRSVTLAGFVSSPGEVFEQAALLLAAMAVPPEEIRGLGITASKLDSDAASHTARPSVPPPSKMPPGKQTVYDPAAHPWMEAWLRPKDKDKQQQQQQAAQAAAAAAGSSGPLTPQKRQLQQPGSEATVVAGEAEEESGNQPAAAAAAAAAKPKRTRTASSPAVLGQQKTLPGLLQQQQVQQQPQQQSPPLPADLPLRQQVEPDVGTSPSQDLELVASQPPKQRQQSGLAARGPAAAAAAEDDGGDDDNDDVMLLSSPPARRQLFSAKQPAASAAAAAGSSKAAAAGSSKAAAAAAVPAAAGAAAAGDTPIAALPPMSQLDPDVLAALPADVRRELEAAYRSSRTAAQATSGVAAAAAAAASGGGVSGGAGLSAAAGGGGAGGGASGRPGRSGGQQARAQGSRQGAARGRSGSGSPWGKQQQQMYQHLHQPRPAAAAAGASGAGGSGGVGASGGGGSGGSKNWLQKGADAARRARQQQQQQASRHWHNPGVLKRNGKAAAGVQKRPHHHPPELLMHMHQVDPSVLAELPPELQQELRAALLGGRSSKAAARQHQQARGGEAGPAGSSSRQAGLRQAAGGGGASGQQQPQLFVAEPLPAVLAALQAALDALAPVSAAAAVAGDGDGSEGLVGEAVCSGGSDGAEEEAGGKLLVLGEYVAQWAAAQVAGEAADLAGLRQLLRLVQGAGQQRPAFRGVAEQLLGCVQQRVLARFGFVLKL